VSGEKTGFASVERMVASFAEADGVSTGNSDMESGIDSQKGKER